VAREEAAHPSRRRHANSTNGSGEGERDRPATGDLRSAVSAPNIDFGQIRAMAVPADSDYNTYPSNVWVEERSAETFNIVNEGDYIAQIDVGQCSQDKDYASSAAQKSRDQSSTSNKPEYEFWTVNSSRLDGSSPASSRSGPMKRDKARTPHDHLRQDGNHRGQKLDQFLRHLHHELPRLRRKPGRKHRHGND
jgi:hypothetical protein